eukprot:gene5316-10627_t
MSKFGRKIREAPSGFEILEPTLQALDNELREKVNEPHEGLRKSESQWPVHQINWQKSRYVYDMFYIYKKISRDVYEYCVKNKIIDASLIAKWKKPGYERLCSTYVINPRNYKFGTVSICRVPKQSLAPGTVIEDPVTGCRGCASGPGGNRNIFGNKYGQYLAAIQVAREERLAQLQLQENNLHDDDEDEDDDDNEDDEEQEEEKKQDLGPVCNADGSSGSKNSVWAQDGEENIQLPQEVIGQVNAAAAKEGKAALKAVPGKREQDGFGADQGGKRQRHS